MAGNDAGDDWKRQAYGEYQGGLLAHNLIAPLQLIFAVSRFKMARRYSQLRKRRESASPLAGRWSQSWRSEIARRR
jgi:hypothetical protein